jgi:Rrf2 family protein
MLANSSKYAIKALHHIVMHASEDHKLLVKDIAEATQLPRPFLSKLLQQLATKNLISSSKGRNGGFYLSEAQLQGSILDVIIEIEGKDRLKMCAINFDNCDAQNPCPIHHLIAAEKDELYNSYRAIAIKDLA